MWDLETRKGNYCYIYIYFFPRGKIVSFLLFSTCFYWCKSWSLHDVAGTLNMPTLYHLWVWEREAHINWSVVTCQGSTCLKLP